MPDEKDVVWEDPAPPKTGRNSPHNSSWLKTLKGRPNEWALVTERGASGAGYNIRRNARPEEREFIEIANRSNGDGTHRVYVRWTGPKGGLST